MSDDAGEFVRLEVEDGIGTIRLDRPPMNPLSVQVQEEIRAAAQEAGARTDVRAVVVYGGEKVFAAGADIKEMQTMSYTDMVERSVPLQSSITAVARIPKPTVAAVTGYALGGGCELALACDFRVAGDNAKLGQPEILLGIIPGAGGTQRLSRLVGPARAKEIIFSGRMVSAGEALGIGLVDRVVPADEVYATSLAWMRPFVSGPAYALRAAKEAIDRGLESDLDTGLEIERMLFAALFATRDREIGMTSFVEQGPGKATFEGTLMSAESLDVLVAYVPRTHTDAVLAAVFAAGAGAVGEYEECAFVAPGRGQFRPVRSAHPALGRVGELHYVDEDRVEVVLPRRLRSLVVAALRAAHPYEEPAFHVIATADPA